MFTGIITDIGTVEDVASTAAGTRLAIATAYDLAAVKLGASIACDGACLTVAAKDSGCFWVDASPETLACTTMGGWKKGRKVNLERALRAGDELGGHIVTGHVDATVELLRISSPRLRGEVRRGAGFKEKHTPTPTPPPEEGGSQAWTLALPPALAPFVAAKGSVTLDGISLTVNAVEKNHFTVSLIPHTLSATTLSHKKTGDRLNLEADIIARYVHRHLTPDT